MNTVGRQNDMIIYLLDAATDEFSGLCVQDIANCVRARQSRAANDFQYFSDSSLTFLPNFTILIAPSLLFTQITFTKKVPRTFEKASHIGPCTPTQSRNPLFFFEIE